MGNIRQPWTGLASRIGEKHGGEDAQPRRDTGGSQVPCRGVRHRGHRYGGALRQESRDNAGDRVSVDEFEAARNRISKSCDPCRGQTAPSSPLWSSSDGEWAGRMLETEGGDEVADQLGESGNGWRGKLEAGDCRRRITRRSGRVAIGFVDP